MVGYANRCVCTTLKGRRCLNAFRFVCDKRKVCYIHANTNYWDYALRIQTAYKGYCSRKYVKLLAKLPCDIQQKILYYVREPHYNAKRNKSIQKILCKRFDALLGTPKAICAGFIMSNINVFLDKYRSHINRMTNTQLCDHVFHISQLYRLYTKYATISDVNYENALYHVNTIVKKYIDEIVRFLEIAHYRNTDINNNVILLQNNINAFKSKYLNLNINS